MGRPCCCDQTACGTGDGATRHYWVDPPSSDYLPLTLGGGEAPEFAHDADEAILSLPDDQSASLTVQRDITPSLPTESGYDSAGHFVYILSAAVRRVAGAVHGVAMFGRYALMFHDDERKWKAHPCSNGGTLGDPLAELEVQDEDRSAATLYLIRHDDGTVRLRMMATYCTAAPQEFVADDPGAWPTTARVGLLGLNGGSWEYWRVGCGPHKNRCSGQADGDLVHGAQHSATPFTVAAYPFASGLSGFAQYEGADVFENSGSIYTEVHNTDDSGGELGQILFQGSIGRDNGTLPGLRLGVFVGTDMIIWEPGAGGTGMFSYSACTVAGVPTGSATDVRDQRMLGAVSQMVFTIRRVSYDGGYNLLFYWQGYLIYTKSVSGEQNIFRCGVWWEDCSGWISFGSPRWSCVESVVVPCEGCADELRRNPPIGWSSTINISGSPENCPAGSCVDVVADVTVIGNNSQCGYLFMPYWNLLPGFGSPPEPLTSTSTLLSYQETIGPPACETENVQAYILGVSCRGTGVPATCGANIAPAGGIDPGYTYEAIPLSYAGGPLTLAADDSGCAGGSDVQPVDPGCPVPTSITLTPIYTPIVWLHTP
jgi:hypothetical protein